MLGNRELPLWCLSGLLAGCVFGSVNARAAPADQAGIELFERKIRPVLVKECYSCHSSRAKTVKGGLRLDTSEGLKKGGDSGPAVIAGKPEESLLLDALRHDGIAMPPRGKLSDTVIGDFERWVTMGAPDPRPKATAAGHGFHQCRRRCGRAALLGL